MGEETSQNLGGLANGTMDAHRQARYGRDGAWIGATRLTVISAQTANRMTGLGMRPPFGPDDTPAVGRGHPVTCSCTKTVQMLLPYRRVSRPHPQ